MPLWFLRLLVPVCSGWIAMQSIQPFAQYIYHLEQWRVARIRPVVKTKTPTGPGNFRSISVIPVLSRILERIAVSRYIDRALAEPPINKLIQDQFAFGPTGSTSAALIDLLQKTTVGLLIYYESTILSISYRSTLQRPSTR